MGFKFFVYRYAEEKDAAEIVSSIGQLTEVAKRYNHKEEMLLFAVLPPKHLAEVAKLVDRNHVKITQACPVLPGKAETAAVIQALKEQGVDAVLWEGCTAEDAPEEKSARRGGKATKWLWSRA